MNLNELFPVSPQKVEELRSRIQRLKINLSEIEEQFVRGSGHGGQKINKTSSCVWLRHLPTGIEVRCQEHREQSKNRLSAYKLLILKIEDRVKGAASVHAQNIFKLKKQKKKRSKRAQRKVLEGKKRRGEVKETRKKVF